MQKTAAPESTKKLTACLECKIVLTQEQFLKKYDGKCPNYKSCGTVNLDDIDTLREKTTSNFSGLIAKMGEGWVSQWQNIGEPNVPGVYAIDVKSDLRLLEPNEYEEDEDDERDEREV